ncbi:MAG: type IV toxin-antitoxin system AbiEi family antitoxin domain-containing protein [Planctomycetota bacterium]
MNEISDVRSIERLRSSQRGVFSMEDLRTVFAEPHRAALYRRIKRLVAAGVLERFDRGIYVASPFEPRIVSQRLAPESAVSFENVLADALIIGPKPRHRIFAIRSGRSRTVRGADWTIEYRTLDASLRFGETVEAGIRRTVPEKALLDVLSFHLRGRRALFDIYSDVDLDRLDRERLSDFLEAYANPRFVSFAKDALRLA